METSNSSDIPGTFVSFTIHGPNMNPEKVSEILNLVPDSAHMKGSYPRNDPNHSPYREGLWSLRSRLPHEKSLPVHLQSFLSILEPKQEQILKLSEDYTVDFYCSLYAQGGLQISSYLLKRIANFGAGLSVTIYPSDTVIEGENS